jgi:hypothetical protein
MPIRRRRPLRRPLPPPPCLRRRAHLRLRRLLRRCHYSRHLPRRLRRPRRRALGLRHQGSLQRSSMSERCRLPQASGCNSSIGSRKLP